jgi:hypothetical protein
MRNMSSGEEPTVASTWRTVAGRPISDELLVWPADLFALTDIILERSEAYRFVFSPPGGEKWPRRRGTHAAVTHRQIRLTAIGNPEIKLLRRLAKAVMA